MHSSSCRSGRGLCFSLIDFPINDFDRWSLNMETKKLTITLDKNMEGFVDYIQDNNVVFPIDNFIDPLVTRAEFNISGQYLLKMEYIQLLNLTNILLLLRFN